MGSANVLPIDRRRERGHIELHLLVRPRRGVDRVGEAATVAREAVIGDNRRRIRDRGHRYERVQPRLDPLRRGRTAPRTGSYGVDLALHWKRRRIPYRANRI